ARHLRAAPRGPGRPGPSERGQTPAPALRRERGRRPGRALGTEQAAPGAPLHTELPAPPPPCSPPSRPPPLPEHPRRGAGRAAGRPRPPGVRGSHGPRLPRASPEPEGARVRGEGRPGVFDGFTEKSQSAAGVELDRGGRLRALPGQVPAHRGAQRRRLPRAPAARRGGQPQRAQRQPHPGRRPEAPLAAGGHRLPPAEWCKELKYAKELPQISIIFIFVNEALSVILRSVHSAVNHTPTHLLKEIILVDDNSDEEELKAPLEEYVHKRYPGLVKVVRNQKREGLIRARIEGWKVATGQVTGFFDAHVEFTAGWAEPVLSRIQENRKRVILPSIDNIKQDTFEVQRYENSAHGYSWELWCMYISPPKDWWDAGDPSLPIRTPAMIGCSFVVNRKFFGEIGLLDPGMDVYGGENIELGIKLRNNKAKDVCLDQGPLENHTAILYPCHGWGPQLARYTKEGFLHLGALGTTTLLPDTRCLVDNSKSRLPQLLDCDKVKSSLYKRWNFIQNGAIMNKGTGRCLEVENRGLAGIDLILRSCTGQRWTIKNSIK
uniref:Polypeptide N-acetylgalactosaminyltransferase n=1 Tax=Canis lupus familiaris TaxID=9615 RepID=A0A8C0NIE3_CANLF